MDEKEDFRNLINSIFNFFHSLFIPYQLFQRFRYRKLFKTIEKSPLTNLQKKAIILNEKRSLVIAGAGTGKTSTIIGKVAYLLKNKNAKEDEILVLAFNNKAAKELKNRMKLRIDANVRASTFHSLGFEILKQTEHNHPKLSDLEGQDIKLKQYIQNIVEELLLNSNIKENVNTFFSEMLIPPKDEFKFKTYKEYNEWSNKKLKSFNNEQLKSYGELFIANYLTLNGIKYEYEKQYKPSVKSNNNKHFKDQYSPDFYLSDYDVYIEYFGFDEKMKTAKYIDNRKYTNDFKWKIKTHKEYGTKLIDLRYADLKQKKLMIKLKSKLIKHKIKLNPISQKDILSKIQDNKYENQFVDLVKNFLQHYKANIDLISFEQLKIDAKKDSRKIIFIEIFELIFEKYQQRLNESNQIDFSDMISNATTKINEKKYISPWKYIIIDEFQDLSQSRYQLINSLLIQNLKTKLFCVGDDWQSIYRFSGSDLNLMKSFRHYFGKATIVKLNLTFRFNDMIAYTSEKFIIKNKNQIIKNIYTKFFSKTPKIFIWYLYPDINKSLSIWIEKNKERLKGLNLQLLSRYTHSVEDVNKNKLDSKWYSDVLENITIHKSKGLESDVVIVTDLTQESGFGFPSMKEDDPILELLLPVADKYPYAEERRLMYVAMTRAKNETHLFTYNESPSKFIKELANKKIYKTEVYKNNEKINYCPSEFCVENKGIIMKKTYEKKISFECSLYPNCKYIPGLCLDCEQGFTQIPNMFCSDSDCSNKSDEDLCPKCKLGIMKYRENKYETKMKCSNYKQCDYKENLKPEPPPMLTDKEILNFK